LLGSLPRGTDRAPLRGIFIVSARGSARLWRIAGFGREAFVGCIEPRIDDDAERLEDPNGEERGEHGGEPLEMVTSKLSLLVVVGVALGALASVPPDAVVEVVRPECVHCVAPFILADLQLLDGGSAWATGHYVTPGNSGVGESVLLMTDDRGRSWRQVPLAFQQHQTPAFYVLDPRQAWVSLVDMDTGDGFVTYTGNGGSTWRPIRNSVGPFQVLQFLDELHGYAVSYRLGAGCNFASTTDGGRQWSLRSIPVEFVDRLRFADQRLGWIVGTGKQGRKTGVSILRTNDGGSTWRVATLEEGREVTVRDFEWADRDRGFLVVASSAAEGKGKVFTTADSGVTWVSWEREPFNRGEWSIEQIRFISPKRGVMVGKKGERPYLGWTDDSGLSWHEQPLAGAATSCAAGGRMVWCIAGKDLLRISIGSVLRPSRAGVPD